MDLYEKITRAWPFPSENSNHTITLKDVVGTSVIAAILLFIGYLLWKPSTRKWGILATLGLVALSIIEPYTYVIPYNLGMSVITNTPPYLNKSEYFPEHILFEDSNTWKKIRAELDQVLKDVESIPFIHEIDKGQSYIGQDSNGKSGGWRLFALKMMNKNIEKNRQLMPFTSNLIDSVPRINTAMFSILDGNKHIPIHTGYYKGILRYHLGMIVPEPDKTVIHVHDQPYHWKEGEGVVFDDMFPHYVNNPSPHRRVVLWFDLKRPLPAPFDSVGNWMDQALYSSGYVKRNARKAEKQQDL
jgi:beta-hydroxylase